MPPIGHPPSFKNETYPTETSPPPSPLKSEAPFQEMIARKKKVPQERDFLTWSIKNFVRKVKQFV